MRILRLRPISAALALGGALALAGACSASGNPGSGGHGNAPGAGNSTGAGATSGASASGNNGSAAFGNIVTDSGSPDAACQTVKVDFVPKIPTVFVLVDRSDSMFTVDNTTKIASWDPLKVGVLGVIKDLQTQIRFGFGAVTGLNGGMCPDFAPIAPAFNNSDAISAVYQPLGKIMGKGETPITMVLPIVQDLLNKAGTDGEKYILFVTDGEPDFCDDGDASCPVDALVARVQKLAAVGIHTIVFGLKSAESPISDQTLQAVANAGAGQPVKAPFTNGEQGVCYSCTGRAGWAAEWKANNVVPECMTVGKQALGTYAAADGTAVVYHPNPADQAALTQQIASVVSGIKSCTFDLGGKISVILDMLSQASVSIEGKTVPLSTDNGWRMNNTTQLELVGDACATWRDPKNSHIDFHFPCETILK